MAKPIEADLSGKTCIVTGANTGIGKQIAHAFARMNATVVLACRNEEKGQAALESIQKATGNDKLTLELVDLSRRESIQSFTQAILDKCERIDVLVNNAGVWPVERFEVDGGHELTFATNVLGYFRVTEALLERMKQSAPSRIVNVASSFAGGLDMNDLHFEKRPFNGPAAYKQSKQANRMLTWNLAERLKGTNVTANAIHPGSVNTELNRSFTGLVGKGFQLFFSVFGKTPADGADTAVYVSVSKDLEGVSGQFFADRKAKNCAFRDPAAIDSLYRYCQQHLE